VVAGGISVMLAVGAAGHQRTGGRTAHCARACCMTCWTMSRRRQGTGRDPGPATDFGIDTGHAERVERIAMQLCRP
jgi:hypothetical protein